MLLYSFGQVRATRLRSGMRTSLILNTQHVAGWPNARNMLRYVAFICYDRLAGACKCWANNVGICCAEMLQSFDWGFTRKMLRPTMLRYVAWKCCDRLAGALQTKMQLIARAFLSSEKCW